MLMADPVEALIALRNGLSHGSAEIHSPGMALKILAACADWIYLLFPSLLNESGSSDVTLLGESLPLRPSQVSADPIERGAPQAVLKRHPPSTVANWCGRSKASPHLSSV